MYRSLLKPAFDDIKKIVLDTLFPINCLVCGEEGKFLCQKCAFLLLPAPAQYCLACQKPSPFGLTHPACVSPQGPDRFVSFFDYHDENVSKILIEGKYHFLPGVYEKLGELIADKIKINHLSLISNHSLVPLPLHPFRLRWRGFNQSEILCEILSRKLNLPVINALTRNKSTKTQKDLKKEQRLKNMEGAFTLSKCSPSPLLRGDVPSASEGQRGRINQRLDIKGQNFILVDDVSTTGATLLEACQVLKRNGASSVTCLTVAKD